MRKTINLKTDLNYDMLHKEFAVKNNAPRR